MRGSANARRRSVALVVALFAIAPAPLFAAQTLAQLTLPSSAPATSSIVQDGAFLSAPIALDGANLFRIAEQVNAPASQLPIALRQSDVQTALAQIVAMTANGRSTDYDPQTLRVHVQRSHDLDSLEAVDAKHPDPLPIVTVTSVDANYNALSIDNLATEWQTILQSALIRALERREPAVERRSLELVARVAAACGAASVFVWLLASYLGRLRDAAETEGAARERDAKSQEEKVVPGSEDLPRARRRFLALSLKNLEPARRARLYRAVAELLAWTVALTWFVAITWAFSLFPQTTPLADSLARGTLRVVITLVATGLLNRILDIVISSVANASEHRPFANSEDRARLMLRIPTIASTLAGFKTFILVFLAILAILGEIGVPIGSVVTIGGLAAIALSLAAQNFVRDFVNGSLVLFEDQYVVGDYVTINTASGIVENLTLRMVQIRDAKGDVVTIPHSSVTTVFNQSRKWSRVDYRVPVDPAADVAKAVDVVRTAIETLASEDKWRGVATLPIESIGVDELSKDWAIVRASIRTAPLRQFEFRRELNARVHAAFGAANIPLGAQLPATSS